MMYMLLYYEFIRQAFRIIMACLMSQYAQIISNVFYRADEGSIKIDILLRSITKKRAS